MHLYKKRKRPAIGVILTVLFFAVFLIYFYMQISIVSEEVKVSDVEMLTNALENAVVTCYAIEGAYPESLEYIEEHYGIVVDRDKYMVDYQVLYANMVPNIAVYTINTDN